MYKRQVQISCTINSLVGKYGEEDEVFIGAELIGGRNQLHRIERLAASDEWSTVCPLEYPYRYFKGTSFVMKITYDWLFFSDSKEFTFSVVSDGENLMWLRTAIHNSKI